MRVCLLAESIVMKPLISLLKKDWHWGNKFVVMLYSYEFYSGASNISFFSLWPWLAATLKLFILYRPRYQAPLYRLIPFPTQL